MKINFGSGETKLEGYVNIDIEESTKPDVVCNVKFQQLPFKNEEVELINMSHCIEHIEFSFWPRVFLEFWRVLKPEGALFLAYPEFEKCSKYFLENHLGLREFFRATLYGRQLYPGDYHVVPMCTWELIDKLTHCGFHDIKSCSDPDEDWNTVLICKKGELPLVREDILRKEIFHQ